MNKIRLSRDYIIWVGVFTICLIIFYFYLEHKDQKYNTSHFTSNVQIYNRRVIIDDNNYRGRSYSEVAKQLDATIVRLGTINYTYIDLEDSDDKIFFIYDIMRNISSDKIAYKVSTYTEQYEYRESESTEKSVVGRKSENIKIIVRVEMMKIVEE